MGAARNCQIPIVRHPIIRFWRPENSFASHVAARSHIGRGCRSSSAWKWPLLKIFAESLKMDECQMPCKSRGDVRLDAASFDDEMSVFVKFSFTQPRLAFGRAVLWVRHLLEIGDYKCASECISLACTGYEIALEIHGCSQCRMEKSHLHEFNVLTVGADSIGFAAWMNERKWRSEIKAFGTSGAEKSLITQLSDLKCF